MNNTARGVNPGITTLVLFIYLVGIKHPGRTKLVVLTDDGIAKAKDLERKYLK